MDSKAKYEYWKEISDYDLKTAEAMYNSGCYLYVAFMCQQSIEKLVKGIYVLHYDIEAPRTHNIWLIISKLLDDQYFIKDQVDYLLDNKIYFADLLYYYISERYPTYKERISSRIDKEKAFQIVSKTKEVFSCLISQYK